jgi:hypothetical protein
VTYTAPDVRIRRALLAALAGAVLAVPASSQPDRITIPAVASIVGVSPFFSDVRVFNTSYVSAVEITATYRCFLGSCPAAPASDTFVLAPREARAFDDMVAATFHAQNSGGGVELDIESGGSASDVAVTSRLYSTEPEPTVGMFIPGKTSSAAHRYSMLTQISNASGDPGFRTNVGAFNGEDTAATVTFAVYWQGHWVGEVSRPVPAHSGVQINDVFGPNGINHRLLETTDGVVTVKTDGPAVFTYAAVIDNHTTDPIFVTGAPDVPPVLSVGGAYDTHVSLGQNTCGSVTVQDNPTTVVQTPGSHTLTLTHAGITYDGTVQDDGTFTTQPKSVSAGGSQFTISIQGQFSPQGFTATVRVDQTAPTTCFYLVDWNAVKQAGANFFP